MFLFLGTILSMILANTPWGYWVLSRVLGLAGVCVAIPALLALVKLIRYGSRKGRSIREISTQTVCVSGVVEAVDPPVDEQGSVASFRQLLDHGYADETRHHAARFLLRDPSGAVFVDPGQSVLLGDPELEDYGASKATAKLTLRPGDVAFVRGRAVSVESPDAPKLPREPGVEWVILVSEGGGFFAAGSEGDFLYPLLRRTLFLLPTAAGLLAAAYAADLARLS